MDNLNALYLIAYLAILIGLIGSVLPVLPGPLLIWGGVFVWAWGNQFERIGWPTLIVLGVLALTARVLDFVLTTSMSRRAGVSWRAIGGALVGAILGAIFLSALPIIGTFVGAILGAVIGMWLVEYWVKGDQARATNAVRAYLSGVTLSAVVQIVIAFLMVSLFVWQAFL
jgi:uncharacterized protein YqgC (DUF456 family)